jgi:hypothetical protein
VKRLLIALAIAAGIYGIAAGTGTLLYTAGVIATGATSNTCDGIKQQIAEDRYNGDEERVPREELKLATQQCLARHELTKEEAFREEYLFWSIWPGVISALVFLLWPAWSRILQNQDEAELAEQAPRLEAGT